MEGLGRRLVKGKNSESYPVNYLILIVITWYVSDQKLFNTVVSFFVCFFNQSNLNGINAQFIDLLTRSLTHIFKNADFIAKLWKKV